MQYRPEIDGLRAVAVLAVVFHHVDVPGFSGGFVGVDIFFVISGYLISSIILSEVKNGTFSLTRFYSRRVRRIVPALVGVTFATALVGSVVLLPNDFENLGQSIFATMAFSSNIFFWLKTGYFAPSAESLPLLHTWSLGVEEQFYLLWPLIMLLLLRKSQLALIVGTIGLMTASIISAELTLQHGDPDSVFFLSHYRFWELLMGALVAFFPRPKLDHNISEIMTISGLVMLAVPIALYSSSTSFPGVSAVLPCAGAMVIIIAARDSRRSVAAILCSPPFRYFGLISYSLYLWHWPVLALYAYSVGQSDSILTKTGLLAFSWLLAHISYQFIESPFRKPKTEIVDTRVILFGSVSLAVVGVTGLFIHLNNGFPQRLPTTVQEMAAKISYTDTRSDCLAWRMEVQPEHCTLGNIEAGTTKKAILWGDSQAGHLHHVLGRVFDSLEVGGNSLIKYGCAPGLDVNVLPGCREFNATAWQQIIALSELEILIIAADWARPNEPAFSIGSHLEPVMTYFADSETKVVLIGALPTSNIEPTKCLAVEQRLMKNFDRCMIPYDKNERLKESDDELRKVAQQYPSVGLLLPSDLLCENGLCKVQYQNKPLYRDNSHLIDEASLFLAEPLRELITSEYKTGELSDSLRVEVD